jgi:hypothetical protein
MSARARKRRAELRYLRQGSLPHVRKVLFLESIIQVASLCFTAQQFSPSL